MLRITLHLDGEKKTFYTDFISGYMFRKALELDEKRNKYLKKVLDQQETSREEQEELLNELYTFISEVFGKQFTPEQYEQGTDARRIVDQSWAIVHGIISQTLEPLSELEDDDSQKKKKSNRSSS